MSRNTIIILAAYAVIAITLLANFVNRDELVAPEKAEEARSPHSKIVSKETHNLDQGQNQAFTTVDKSPSPPEITERESEAQINQPQEELKSSVFVSTVFDHLGSDLVFPNNPPEPENIVVDAVLLDADALHTAQAGDQIFVPNINDQPFEVLFSEKTGDRYTTVAELDTFEERYTVKLQTQNGVTEGTISTPTGVYVVEAKNGEGYIYGTILKEGDLDVVNGMPLSLRPVQLDSM